MRRHPDWLRVPIAGGVTYRKVKNLLRERGLHTICEEAKCPNRGECFNRGTATFLILGDICTRHCLYCAVKSGKPKPVDPLEPKKVAEAVNILGLKYAVITSVTRDDLPDGGAEIFYETIIEIKNKNPSCTIEILIPDFRGNDKAIHKIIEAKPDVINHNIEVVEELFPKMRPQGNYNLSLNLLQKIKEIDSNIITKSGFMIGLGEDMDQIIRTMQDLRDRDVDVLTIGQYLQPSMHHTPIMRYYTPDEFKYLKDLGYQMGFLQVESAPLVRSSYHADDIIDIIKRVKT